MRVLDLLMRVLDSFLKLLEECLRAAQTLVISQAATLALHIAAILVVLIESWWKPYRKLSRVGTVVVSPDGFWRDGIIFVPKYTREKSRCKKRICDVLYPSISSCNKPFPP